MSWCKHTHTLSILSQTHPPSHLPHHLVTTGTFCFITLIPYLTHKSLIPPHISSPSFSPVIVISAPLLPWHHISSNPPSVGGRSPAASLPLFVSLSIQLLTVVKLAFSPPPSFPGTPTNFFTLAKLQRAICSHQETLIDASPV